MAQVLGAFSLALRRERSWPCFPKSRRVKVFSRPGNADLSGVFAPRGRATAVDGGFQVEGQWQWGSGTQNADWDSSRLPSHSRRRARAPQEWHTSLSHDVSSPQTKSSSSTLGTSQDSRVRVVRIIAIHDQFVPVDHALGLGVDGPLPGPLYAFPQFGLLGMGIAAVSLGLARAAIDELITIAGGKTPAGSARPLAARASAQTEVARAEATLRAARAFYYETIESAWQAAQEFGRIEIDHRRDIRLATTFTVHACAEAVDRMYNLGGGTSVYRRSPLQRIFRDVPCRDSTYDGQSCHARTNRTAPARPRNRYDDALTMPKILPLRVGTLADHDMLTGPLDRRRSLLERARSAGLDHVFVADHISFFTGMGMDGLIQAATIAALESELRVYVGVYLLALRHPLPVARQLASLAESAPGRLILGIGVGGEDRHEIEICGVDPATRGRRTNETLLALRKLQSGTPVSHQCEFFDFEDAFILPAPDPPIPFIIGGRSDAAIKRTAHLGDGWLGVWCSPDVMPKSSAKSNRRVRLARFPSPNHGTTGFRSGWDSTKIVPALADAWPRPWKRCTASPLSASNATALMAAQPKSRRPLPPTSHPDAVISTSCPSPKTLNRPSTALPKFAIGYCRWQPKPDAQFTRRACPFQ